MGPLLSETGDLVTRDVRKAEAPNAIIASVFASKIGLQESQVPETRGKVWSMEKCLAGKGSDQGILRQTGHT